MRNGLDRLAALSLLPVSSLPDGPRIGVCGTIESNGLFDRSAKGDPIVSGIDGGDDIDADDDDKVEDVVIVVREDDEDEDIVVDGESERGV